MGLQLVDMKDSRLDLTMVVKTVYMLALKKEMPMACLWEFGLALMMVGEKDMKLVVRLDWLVAGELDERLVGVKDG